jgi:hypothetical protein
MASWGKDITVEWITTGVYKLTHNFGYYDYMVQITGNQAGVYFTCEGIYSNYCMVYCRNFSGTLVDADFTYLFTGHN